MMNEIREATKNFEECQIAMQNLSIVDIVRAIDYIAELSTFIPDNNEVLGYASEITQPLMSVIEKCHTGRECPHCGCFVFKSDLPQYDYVCVECDENFYECEVK